MQAQQPFRMPWRPVPAVEPCPGDGAGPLDELASVREVDRRDRQWTQRRQHGQLDQIGVNATSLMRRCWISRPSACNATPKARAGGSVSAHATLHR